MLASHDISGEGSSALSIYDSALMLLLWEKLRCIIYVDAGNANCYMANQICSVVLECLRNDLNHQGCQSI